MKARDSFERDGDGDLVWSWMFGDESTNKLLFDEINNTLSNDNEGIAKLINKYAVTDIFEGGYGCTEIRITFDGSLDKRDDKVFDEIDEYLSDLIISSDWMGTYNIIHSVIQEGWEEIAQDGSVEDLIQYFIDSVIECGFSDDEGDILAMFEDAPNAAEIINKHLVMKALTGKFKGKFKSLEHEPA